MKTTPTDADVAQFIASVADPQKRADAQALIELMQSVTGAPPRMWGSNIVGFGNVHYRYATGREGDWFVLGFSPRKQNLTLYLSANLAAHSEELANLGKHTTGKGCVYLKRLSDADPAALRKLLESAAAAQSSYNAS